MFYTPKRIELIPFKQIEKMNFEKHFLRAIDDDYEKKIDIMERKFLGEPCTKIINNLQCASIKDVYVTNYETLEDAANWTYICKNCFQNPQFVASSMKKIYLHNTILRKSQDLDSHHNFEELCHINREYLCSMCKVLIYDFNDDITKCFDCNEKIFGLLYRYVCKYVQLC